jgi:hypothetical protein
MADVVHKDKDCVVLHPRCDRGILVSAFHDKIIGDGIYSAFGAVKQGLSNRARSYLNRCVFFRPHAHAGRYQIRVDPKQTHVFDQEYHAKYGNIVNEPKLTLSDYLDKITNLKKPYDYIYWYSFYLPIACKYPIASSHDYRKIDAHRFYEVRVNVDVVPLEWLVHV